MNDPQLSIVGNNSFLNKNTISRFKYIIAGVLIIIFIGVLYFLILRSKNSTTLQIYPKSKTSITAESLVFHCPTIPSFCQSETPVGNGIGGVLPKDTPLYAAFDGTVSSAKTTLPPSRGSETYMTLILSNPKLGLFAAYYFNGKTDYAGKKVKMGNTIGILNGTPIKNYGGSSLVFMVIHQPSVKKSGTVIHLTPKKFTK
ncbi:MAG: hypothetical protein M1426_00225 [Patescibacteria group bacterium]|nr:hypothetical protein [Patescibacteria group bacterium]